MGVRYKTWLDGDTGRIRGKKGSKGSESNEGGWVKGGLSEELIIGSNTIFCINLDILLSVSPVLFW